MGGRYQNFEDPSLSEKVMRKIKFQKCTYLLRHALNVNMKEDPDFKHPYKRWGWEQKFV